MMRRLYSTILLLSSCVFLMVGCSPAQQQSQRDPEAVDQPVSVAAATANTVADTPLATSSASPGERYSDPFTYCQTVTTIDAADERYAGDAVPHVIVQGLHQATGGQGDPPDWLPKTIQWRCMDGKVYACTVGANLPCDQKANTSQTPSDALKEFCRNNPNQPVRSEKNSIYVWTCADGTPKIQQQWTSPDAAGFLAKIWYEIKAP